ncbi:MAG: leucyl/phenylalanyl-tRNA--protein transferase [Pseudomonadota bacterium]
MLLEAYRLGFFPMAESRQSDELMWVRPTERGIFPLNQFHVPRSLAKVVRQERFTVKTDTAFVAVMEACASAKAGRDETWINAEIIEAYSGLHQMGHAHSVEAWCSGALVGGLYGVSIAGAFFGESMFSLKTDASKVALCHLVARLKFGGYNLLDTQFLTPHLERFGGIGVPAEDYEELLAGALQNRGAFNALTPQTGGSAILQLITQTS